MTNITRRELNLAGLISLAGVSPALGKENGTSPAMGFLRRQIGNAANKFSFSISNQSKNSKFFNIKAQGGNVAISGSDCVSQCRGVYKYLFETGAFHSSWEGNSVHLPRRFDDSAEIKIETPFLHRSYLNPCAFGYTTPYWDWTRWEREIDFMVSRGIDMPLAMEGQEYVWRLLWKEEGLSEKELDDYFCAPPFLPWARMGNIEGYFTPTPISFYLKKRDIQKKIFKRMNELGMSPILPAFGGYVPHAWANKYKSAKTIKMNPWGGFKETYWLDPNDDNFARLGKRFLELYTKTYGAGEYYLADSFNEMQPKIPNGGDKAKILGDYAAKIYQSIANFSPSATWVMQGWLFESDQDFWTPDAVKAYLAPLPDDKVLILDIGNDYARDLWEKDKAFFGKKWIFGYIHNFGANNAINGDLSLYKSDLSALAIDGDKGNLFGFGVFPEGLNTSTLAYDFMLEAAWQPKGLKLQDYLKKYCIARYGSDDATIFAAISEIADICYKDARWERGWWRWLFGTYLFMKKPSEEFSDFDGKRFDLQRFANAIEKLLSVYDAHSHSKLFHHDLVELIAHCGILQIDEAIITTLKALKANDFENASLQREKINSGAGVIDHILGYQEQSFANWRLEARKFGETKAEMDFYENSAIAQVTVWGGDNVLDDYASKLWQGLIKDYYLPRWNLFFDEFTKSQKTGEKFDSKAVREKIHKFGRDWVANPPEIYKSVPQYLPSPAQFLSVLF